VLADVRLRSAWLASLIRFHWIGCCRIPSSIWFAVRYALKNPRTTNIASRHGQAEALAGLPSRLYYWLACAGIAARLLIAC